MRSISDEPRRYIYTHSMLKLQVPSLTKTKKGTFTYSKAFGKASMKPDNNKPMQLDTIMWIASCTKLMTSISALQLVERGLVSLDDPVYKHLPELESRTVIKGFTDAGEPIEEKHTKPITLRNLLSHSSGLAYEFIHPVNQAWLKYHNRAPASSGNLVERFSYPLVFEPGESWAYGPGIDFAGLLIERISGQTLEDYMKANIWTPLGIKDMTFSLSSRPDLAARLADMSARNPSTGKVVDFSGPLPYVDGEGKEVTSHMGGQGVFASMEEYAKILKALLDADGGKEGAVLKKESVDELCKAQLGDKSRETLTAALEDKAVCLLFFSLSQCLLLCFSNTVIMELTIRLFRQAMRWVVCRLACPRIMRLVAFF